MAWAEKSGKRSWRVRYFRTDGTIGSIPGFPTKKAAETRADKLENDQRGGTWTDPAHAKIPFAAWVEDWLPSIDVSPRTEETYRSKLRTHIVPRWGTTGLGDISGTAAATWAKELRATHGLAPVTVSDTMKLFSLILADAVDENLIPANPIRPRRRGRMRRTRTPEKVWATPVQVIQIADQAVAYYGLDAGILVLTAAWTGARWGELTGLQRPNLHVDDARLVIDPDIGCLHESNSGTLSLGPPKTPESARTITLPAFLIPLLRAYLDSHDHRNVFVTPDAQLHRRSNFSRRAMRPAADGNLDIDKPRVRTHPIRPGLTFHGLRHSHKTWMIADGVPDVAQARRLGHKLPDKIAETYSHVAQEVEDRLHTALATRWTAAVTIATSEFDASWRQTDRPDHPAA